MLYPTHHRYGQVYGLVGASIGAGIGLLPVINFSQATTISGLLGEILVALMFVMACYRGSVFGAEFPDIDSPGSIPARKHFFLQKLFRFFKIKHRGKFSHDFTSLLIVFGSIYLLLDLFLGPSMKGLLALGVGDSNLTPLIALLSSGGLLLSLLKTYVVFVLVGAYSHLLADASTKQGVWLFWRFRIHIVPVFITKIEIGGNKPFAQIFNTGTGWEMFNRKLMGYIFLPLSIIACLVMLVS